MLEHLKVSDFGTWMPASTAARISDVPLGTVTCMPSMSSVTSWSDSRSGVPKSVSLS